MRDEIFRVAGSPECREAIDAADLGHPLSIKREAGCISLLDAQGRLLGKVTSRHKFARYVADSGGQELYFSVNSVTRPCDHYPHGKTHVRASYLPHGERCAPASYPVTIIGESFYQDAIRNCHLGDRVNLWHEPDNPYDDHAIAVVTEEGSMLGHIPRGSWLQDAVHRDGKGVSASIMALNVGLHNTGVVLRIALGGPPIRKASYYGGGSPTDKPPVPNIKTKGLLARLFGW